MKYVVIVDSMSNMPEPVLNARDNIKVIPLNTHISGKTELDLLDTERLNQFYIDNPLKEDAKADATSPTMQLARRQSKCQYFLLMRLRPSTIAQYFRVHQRL